MESTVLTQLLQIGFPGLLGFIFLTVFILADKTFPDKILRYIMFALSSCFLLMITDSVNYYFEAQKTHTTLRLFMMAFSFSFKIACSAFCVVISQRNEKFTATVLHSLMTINAIISFISIPTGCVFYIKPDYSVGHGVLYFVPYLMTVINCILLLVPGVKNYKTNKGEAIMCFAMVISTFFATALEVRLHFMLMIPLAFMLCIIFYFMCLNVQLYRRDTLTHLLNRRSFFMDAKRNGKKNMFVLSLDLNNLKYYNDTFGHAAGDVAITTSSHMMELAFSHFGIVYRTGGDEFMVLFINKPKATVEECLETFNALMDKTEYRVAYGVSEYIPGHDFEEVTAESDAKMYRNKMEYKERRAREALARLEPLDED